MEANARSIAVVTTCNEHGYMNYGRNMMASFDRHMPQDIPLYIYHEKFHPDIASDRFFKFDLEESCPDLVSFKQRHRNNVRAHGQAIRRKRIIIQWHKPRIKLRKFADDQGFRWDAVRFSHKVFSIHHAAGICAADILIWMDADIVFHKALTRDVIYSSLSENVLVSFLKRYYHSECSFVVFNLQHPSIWDFLNMFIGLYKNDALFDEKEYHDSYLFDVVRRRFERAGCLTYDIAQGAGLDRRSGHVFENSILGDYMEHLKGRRKERIAPVPPLTQCASTG